MGRRLMVMGSWWAGGLMLACAGVCLWSCSASEGGAPAAEAPPAVEAAFLRVGAVASPELDTLWGEPGAAPGAAWVQIYADEGLQDRLGRAKVGPDGAFAPYSLGDNRLARVFVVAEDAKGRRGAAASATNDIEPPQIVMEATPPAIVEFDTASFVFSCAEPGCTALCSLDQGPASPCRSPHTLQGLGPGPHLFELSAQDAAGNKRAAPLPFSFMVNLPRREVRFTKTPTALTDRGEASFAFACGEPTCALECQLDQGRFEPCASPHEVKVKPGFHSLHVRLLAGPEAAQDSTASFSWTVRGGKP